MDSPRICKVCRIGCSLYTTMLQTRDTILKRDNKTLFDLTPCDFVALLLDPNGHEHSESSSLYLDLIRNCFHQCLTLFGNGVSEHVTETIIDDNLPQKE